MTEPYRHPFSVREAERPLEEAELEVVRERRVEAQRRHRREARFHFVWMLGSGVLALVLMLAGAIVHDVPLAAVGAVIGVVFSVIGLAGYRDARRRQRAKPNPWLGDASGWSVRETRILARTLVGAASGDEDYALWVLCEIPGEPWAFFCHDYGMPDLDALARTELRLVTLLPMGKVLRVEADGDPIPLAAMRRDDPDEYVAACERDQTWSPHDVTDDHAITPDDPVGRVDDAVLPRWIRDAVKR